MRQQTGKVTAQLKLKTLNDNPYFNNLTCNLLRFDTPKRHRNYLKISVCVADSLSPLRNSYAPRKSAFYTRRRLIVIKK